MLAAPQHGPRPLPLFLAMLRERTAASPADGAAALAGLAAYQRAPRGPARSLPPAVARAGRARLRDHGGAGPPLVVVPSLINPPTILDLGEDASLMRSLAAGGFRALSVDWGTPAPADAGMDIAAHVETLLIPLLDALGEPPFLAGYCLGGTMALAAAMLRPPRALALIAAPWRFAGFPPAARADIAAMWRAARAGAAALGLVPMEVLQAGFWRIDPAATIGKYIRYGRLDQASAEARRFVLLEDWANDGAPLTLAAGRELFEDFVAADLPGRRRWQVAGARAIPGRIACPILNVVSTTDRIVPRATAIRRGTRLTLAQGHVGMMVGGRARTALWEPLGHWLSRVRDS